MFQGLDLFPLLETHLRGVNEKGTNGSDQGSVELLTCKCSKHAHCDLCTPETIF